MNNTSTQTFTGPSIESINLSIEQLLLALPTASTPATTVVDSRPPLSEKEAADRRAIAETFNINWK